MISPVSVPSSPLTLRTQKAAGAPPSDSPDRFHSSAPEPSMLKPDLRTYLTLPVQSPPTWAPDSRQFVYFSNHTGTSQAYLRAADGSTRTLTEGRQGVDYVAWSPDGQWLLYGQDTDGDERTQLHLMRPDGSGHVNLTDRPGVIHNFGGFSPDSKLVLYSSNARDGKNFDLYARDLETGVIRTLLEREGMNEPLGFSPDAGQVLFETSHSNLNNDVSLLDLSRGQVRTLTSHQGDARFSGARFSQDGKSLFLTSDQGREFMTLSRLELSTGALTPLVEHSWDVESFTVSPDERTLAYTLNEDGYSRLHLLDLTSGESRTGPALPDGVISGLSFRQDGKLSLKLSQPAAASQSLLLDLASGQSEVTLQGSLGAVDPAGLVKPELVHYKSHDGLQIPAFLYRPADVPADKPLPAVVILHGGPESQTRPTFSGLNQYFVDQGFAVLTPNIRGSVGYGKSYSHLDDVEKRPDAIGDVACAARYLGSVGVDTARMAVMGGSYGGYMTLAALAFDRDHWAAGVDIVGMSNLETFMNKTGPWRRKNRAAEYGDPDKPDQLAVLRMWSPLHYVDSMEAPLMVIQGANDPRVPKSEADQVVAAYRQQGKTVEYLLYPDEGHGLDKLENRVEGYTKVATFLNQHLQDQASPAKSGG